MKRTCIVSLFIACLLLAGCGGGPQKGQRQPEHLVAGMKEIQKGIAWYQKGCYQRSLGYFLRAHEQFTASDQLPGVAMSLNNIGNVYRNMGDVPNAILFFEESFDTYWDLKDISRAVQALSNKAAALIDNNQVAPAGAVLSLAEDISRRNNIRFQPLLHNRAILLIKQKKFQAAEAILRQALNSTDASKPAEIATINFAYGNLMLELQQYDTAIRYFQTALDADRSLGFYKGMADDLAAIGTAHLRSGDKGRAANFFKRSIQIYALIENKSKVAQTLKAFEEAAQAAHMDTRVTKHFVNKWSKGKAFQGPCR